MSTLVLRRAEVDARDRLRRTIAPAPETWPSGNVELYRAFLRWLDPNGVPAARARTVLVAVRHLLAVLPFPGAPDALAAASRRCCGTMRPAEPPLGRCSSMARRSGSFSALWRSRPASHRLLRCRRLQSAT
jgi:hypothetical protein